MAMDDQPVEPADIESTDEEQAGGLGAKTFMGIAALVLVIGLGLGGAFAIGVQVGQSQQEGVEETPPLAITAEESFLEIDEDDVAAEAELESVTFVGPGGDGEIPPEVLRQMREEGVSEEQINTLRARVRQFQQGQGQGFGQGRPGFVAGTGGADDAGIGTRMTGTIESIEGDVITLMTPAGPQRISTISGTRITVTQTGDLDDLAIGDRVTVAAVPGPNPEILEAASITAVSVEE